VFARPKFQKFFELIFRLNLSYLGYMNWSPDFKLTGERLVLKKLSKYGIDRILDIGANQGQWAEMALSTLKCQVVSIEPQLSDFVNLSMLKNKFSGRLFTLNLAIGDTDKDVQIHVHDSSSELSYIDDRLNKLPLLSGKSSKKEAVSMLKLDSLFKLEKDLLSQIDFVKIDTEGYEINVLRGGLNYLDSVSPKFIQLEMNWHQLFVNSSLFYFSEVLKNYIPYKVLPSGEYLYKVVSVEPIHNIFQLSNFIFIRKDISLVLDSEL